MYLEKAVFFDAQADAGWAADQYNGDELRKLDLLFHETGSLKGKRVLEPGCGTGRLSEILSRKVGDKGRVVAMDISPAMVEAAEKRVKGASNIELFVSQAELFTSGSENFDLILCHQVFPHMENKGACLEKFHGLLAPGGKVVIFHFIGLEEINNVHRKAGTVIENDMMPDNLEMERLFKGAGFTIKFIRNGGDGYFLMADKTEI